MLLRCRALFVPAGKFTIYSGDDGLILPFMSVGATELIRMLSNIGGGILQDVMQTYEDGRVRGYKIECQNGAVGKRLAMFIETNILSGKSCGNARSLLALMQVSHVCR